MLKYLSSLSSNQGAFLLLNLFIKCFGEVVSGCIIFPPLSEPIEAPIKAPTEASTLSLTEALDPVTEPDAGVSIPGPPLDQSLREPENNEVPLEALGHQRGDGSGEVRLPLYQLRFSISSRRRRFLVEEWTTGKQVYPSIDDFSMMERVVSEHIYGHLPRLIAERKDDYRGTLSDLSLETVKSKVEATHLETTSESEVLRTDLNTEVVFDDKSITQSRKLAELLSDTVKTIFVDEAALAEFDQKLKIESFKLHNSGVGFFNRTSNISWAPLSDTDDSVANFESSWNVSTKPSKVLFLHVLALLILSFIIVVLLLLRRLRNKKKELWSCRWRSKSYDASDSDSDTIVFSDDFQSDKNTTTIGFMPIEHISISEQETVSMYSSKSLFSSHDKLFHGEVNEIFEAGTSRCENCLEDRKKQSSSLSSHEGSSTWNENFIESNDETVSKSIACESNYSFQSEESSQGRSANHEDEIGNRSNDNDVASQLSPIEQLKMEVSEARLDQELLHEMTLRSVNEIEDR